MVKKDRKSSLRRQLALISIGLMAGTILMCWFIYNTFLERYYLMNKVDVINNAYQMMYRAVGGSYVDLKSLADLSITCDKDNISALIIDANSTIRYSTPNGGSKLETRLLKYRLGMMPEELLQENVLFRITDTENANKEYLEMHGSFENGNSYIIRSPMESIQNSVNIANRFLAYVAIAMVILSGLLIWFVTGKITEPILALTRISERMIHLDFEAKYDGKSNNEIALLGENINMLSSSLEKTISELKTANNELKKDIEKKEEIDEMRKEFLSNVSHELKTPIALIQGYAEGLKEGISDDSESRDFYCEVIMDEASKMNNMVKKLLTLNQLEFGTEVITMERFDVTTLISNYIQSAGILTRQNGIEVRMQKYDPVYVWGDEFKTEEVFMNYFTNAVNHCSGKKVIDIKLELKENKVRINVFNTGAPIPEDAIGHLWEKFYKVDKARTREYGGSGVGLSIVKAIMESMNQEYGVTNFTNGVQFWFELETVGDETRAE